MLDALQIAQPVMETALERLVKDPARSGADLRHLDAACGALREEANALAGPLIARHSADDMVTRAEGLFRYFEQVKAQIAVMIEADQLRP